MEQTQKKSYMSIKAKLMAAVAMLLVASFMVISSTYAWFTLSTAPEVTGITTSVGANGNLEMALIYSENADISTTNLTALATAITNQSSTLELKEANKTWGNLVSISDANGNNLYGLNRIELTPARLSVAGEKKLDSTVLAVPSYTADGRIESISASKTVTGIYNGTSFVKNGTGVRAIGAISSMTQQEVDYRAAKSEYTAAINNAYNLAQSALNANVEGLTNLIINKASGATDGYDVTALETMITALAGSEGNKGVVAYLEEARAALVKAMYIVTASASTGTPYVSPVSVAFDDSGNATITLTTGTANVEASTLTASAKYAGLVTKIGTIGTAISSAQAGLAADGLTKTNATWEQTSAIMNPLMNTNQILVGDYTLTGLKDAMVADGVDTSNQMAMLTWVSKNVLSASGNGMTVSMPEGSGLFADVHQATGRQIVTSSTVYGIPVTMKTTPTLIYVATFASDKDTTTGVDILYPTVSDDSYSNDLTELYGYALDFAFRTNAANSFLQLQTEAENRIYSQGGTEETMGGGSFMKFASSDVNNFTSDDVANLMASIRIVFVDSNNNIVAIAGAERVENTTGGTGGAPTTTILSDDVIFTTETGTDGKVYVISDIVLYDFEIAYDADNTAGNGVVTLKGLMKNDADTEKDESCTLMELVKNTPTALSAYVYLDGDEVENGDVAATATSSMTGEINLQFSSSAELVPMDYAPFQGSGTSSSSSSSTSESSTPVAP